MFGIKIVKASDYRELLGELNLAKMNLITRDEKIANLEGEIKGHMSTIDGLRSDIESLTSLLNPESGEAELLTDTAETPLVVEKKVRKSSRDSQATSEKKPRRVIRKKEVTE